MIETPNDGVNGISGVPFYPTVSQYLESIIPKGDRCENCPKADPYITGREGPLLKGYSGPYFCHLHEELIEDGYKICAINDEK